MAASDEPAVLASSSAEPGVFEVRPGIAEIDSYEMLFYGHYPKYCERAANACLTGVKPRPQPSTN